ncbi:class I SAM-dependent methyltransferase [Anditalea andensis]|uniref:Ubiquinone biosynthesis protein UbiE n=1 Tax=Anditalea andensis TaxID=1048983 RepID=A0A074KU60_9BACT|nr:class I SAM-dependent methyltransferase [Anditalea andensis]KEO73516.1 ubiquinone biosynthesis protein UbiE [Anditalea andensis]
MTIQELNKLLGNIDIYLLDQILKGRFTKEMKILDAGCGEGRNTIYFLHEGYQIFGVDYNPIAIQMARIYAQTIQKNYDIFRFQTAMVDDMPFHQGAFDAIISSAVLHFAKDTAHFLRMMAEMMKVLKPKGIFFLRMCTGFAGIDQISEDRGNGVFDLPDGSRRFLLSEGLLDEIMKKYGLIFLEAPKTVLVHGKRTMGTFIFLKNE